MFLEKLSPHIEDYTCQVLADTMISTIVQLNEWTGDVGIASESRYNMAVTDGQNIVATRYVSDAGKEPHSLYYASGDAFESFEGRYRMRPTARHPKAAIIASEPLTEDRSDWTAVPANYLVMVTPEQHLRVMPIP